MVHDDADRAAVLGETGSPLRIREAAGQGGERAGALFQPLGKRLGALATDRDR